MSERESWHLDKRVPLALIVTLIGYGVGGIWYVGRMEARTDARLAVAEQQIRDQANRDHRQDQAASEAITLLRAHLDRMEAKLDRLYERGGR